MTTNNNEVQSVIHNINQPKTILDDKFQKKIIKILIEDENFLYRSLFIYFI